MKYLLIALLALTACTSSSPDSTVTTKLADPSDVIDEDLMISLAQAKNFHHKAKVYKSDGKLDDAIAAVRKILTLEFPKNAPEAEDVRLDARALLGKLLIEKKDFDEAMRVVDEGLAATSRSSFFVANLHTVRGQILDAEADVADAKDKAKAQALRHDAIEAYDRSIKINEALIKKRMEPK